ncbi:MAG TPA: hypothetical protein VFW11_24055 [Cyclobacteriaceae bacterium]|nr:hypothetical protein [Cyclobacteriaceae bacterium]
MVAGIQVKSACITINDDPNRLMVVVNESVVSGDALIAANLRLLVRSDEREVGHHKLKVHDNREVFCHIKPNAHDNGLIDINLRRFSIGIRLVADNDRLSRRDFKPIMNKSFLATA